MTDLTPPERSRWGVIATWAQVPLSAIPLLGGVAAATLAAATQTVEGQRQAEFFDVVAASLEDLRQRGGFRWDDVAEDQAFLDAVLSASRIAATTSREEKLTALHNAVLHCALPGAPGRDVQASFFQLIDELTPMHLHMLSLLDDPGGWFDRNTDLVRPVPGPSSSRHQLIDGGMPELGAELSDVRDRFFADLVAAGLLVIDTLGGMMSGSSLFERVSSGYGRRFLAFIADPFEAGLSDAGSLP